LTKAIEIRYAYAKGGTNTQIRIENQGDFDKLLRKFRRQIIREGVLADFRRHEAYSKPSVKRKQKEAKARRRARMQFYRSYD
jgi:small subunit ribosomal protein S21